MPFRIAASETPDCRHGCNASRSSARLRVFRNAGPSGFDVLLKSHFGVQADDGVLIHISTLRQALR
jgi:hypothetical protein